MEKIELRRESDDKPNADPSRAILIDLEYPESAKTLSASCCISRSSLSRKEKLSSSSLHVSDPETWDEIDPGRGKVEAGEWGIDSTGENVGRVASSFALYEVEKVEGGIGKYFSRLLCTSLLAIFRGGESGSSLAGGIRDAVTGSGVMRKVADKGE